MYIYAHTHPNLSSAYPSLHVWTPALPSAYTSAHARIGGAATHNRPRLFEGPPSASATPAVARRGAEIGAYRGQRGNGRGVPCADVRVEHRHRVQRLRAEPLAVDADGKSSHVAARVTWAPILTRARARARAHTWAHLLRIEHSVIRSSM